jgi:hypothetical protein
MHEAPLQLVAGGNIRPRRLVKVTATNSVVECTAAGDVPIGVSATGVRNAPYSTLDDGFVAIAGEPVFVFSIGATAPMQAGAAVAAGVRVMSDASGRGILATATNGAVGIALQPAAAADQIIDVLVLPHTA